MKTYMVQLTDADGTFIEIHVEAINVIVAVAEAISLVNDASMLPWDVVSATCRVVSAPTPMEIPTVVPEGWDCIEASDVW